MDDPAAVAGTDERRLVVFRRVRDEIAARLRDWLRELDEEQKDKHARSGDGQ